MILSVYCHFGIYMYKLRDQNCTDNRDRVYAPIGLRPYFADWLGKEDESSIFNMET